MQEKAKSYFMGITEKFNNLDKSQKTRLGITILLLVIALGVTVYLAAKPKMVTIFSGLDYKTASEIQTALDGDSIPNNVIQDGTGIEVPTEYANDAKVYLASQNIPHGGTFTYADALDYSGMGTTESMKIENFKRVKESDLSESLKSFSGVESANVELVIPESDNYFIQSEEESSAGVVLGLTEPMEKTEATAIARYVSQSVKGLTMENIEIIDTEGNTLYSGMQQMSSGTASTEYEMETARKNDIESKIKAALAPLYDDVNIVSNLKIDWDKTSSKDTVYTSPIQDSATGLVINENIEKQTSENTTAAAEPGVGANDRANTTYETENAAGSNASVNNRNTTYLQNETQNVTERAIGEIVPEESSISVYVYKNKDYYEDYLKKNNLLNGMSWDEFKEVNQAEIPITVETGIVDALKVGTGIENLSVVGYEVPVFYDEIKTPVKMQEIAIFSILAFLIVLLALGLLRRNQNDDVIEIEQELSVEELLVNTKLEDKTGVKGKSLEARSGRPRTERQSLQEIEFAKQSETMNQIEKFVNEKPEAVAQLMRNWLSEEWE